MADPMNLDAAVEAVARLTHGSISNHDGTEPCEGCTYEAEQMVHVAAPIIAAQALRDAAEELGQDTIVPNFWHWLQDRADALAPRPERNGGNDG